MSYEAVASVPSATPFRANNGSARAPVYTFANDVDHDTGIYRSAENTIAIATGGELRATMTDVLNLHVTTQPPTAPTEGFASLYFDGAMEYIMRSTNGLTGDTRSYSEDLDIFVVNALATANTGSAVVYGYALPSRATPTVYSIKVELLAVNLATDSACSYELTACFRSSNNAATMIGSVSKIENKSGLVAATMDASGNTVRIWFDPADSNMNVRLRIRLMNRVTNANIPAGGGGGPK